MAPGKKRVFHETRKYKADFYVVKHQRGAALIALLAVLVLGTSWTLIARLNAASGDLVAAKRARNAQVLNQAKQALIGYVAAQAVQAGENNPGSLPCPENLGDFDSTSGRQGRSGINCGLLSAQKVGRFPWRTLGTDQLVDADGEPLWYVVSRNWGVDIGGGTRINSASAGLLTVDGVPAVALIIAPGAALAVPAATGCAAWNQVRRSTGTPDWRNYLECENATSPADAAFASRGPRGSFNDQVLAVTAAEVLGGIEAAIAARIQREIIPLLSDVYAASSWGLTGRERMFPFAAAFADPATASYHGAPPQTQGLLPFNYGEACNPATEPRCLLMAWSPATPPVASKPAGEGACASSPGGCGYIQTQACRWDAAAALCEGEYREDNADPRGPGMRIEMTATMTNVANGLRVVDARVEARDGVAPGPWQAMPRDIATTMNADGSATIRFGATLPNIRSKGWGPYARYRIRLKVADHPIVATRPREVAFKWGVSEIRIGQTVTGAASGAVGRVSRVTTTAGTWDAAAAPSAQATGTTTFYSVSGSFENNEDLQVAGATIARSTGADGDADINLSWFARNEWYRHVYYAVANGYAWTGSGACSDSSPVSCLQLANLPIAADQTKQRALLVLMGKRVGAQTRPSTNLADYLESGENRDLDGVFEQLKVGALSNDRFISISKNP